MTDWNEEARQLWPEESVASDVNRWRALHLAYKMANEVRGIALNGPTAEKLRREAADERAEAIAKAIEANEDHDYYRCDDGRAGWSDSQESAADVARSFIEKKAERLKIDDLKDGSAGPTFMPPPPKAEPTDGVVDFSKSEPWKQPNRVVMDTATEAAMHMHAELQREFHAKIEAAIRADEREKTQASMRDAVAEHMRASTALLESMSRWRTVQLVSQREAVLEEALRDIMNKSELQDRDTVARHRSIARRALEWKPS